MHAENHGRTASKRYFVVIGKLPAPSLRRLIATAAAITRHPEPPTSDLGVAGSHCPLLADACIPHHPEAPTRNLGVAGRHCFRFADDRGFIPKTIRQFPTIYWFDIIKNQRGQF
jgi:hypothetical protein